jgi:transposase
MLTDEKWELIKGMFPPPAGTEHLRRDARIVLKAVLRLMRTGCPGPDLATNPTPWQTVDYTPSICARKLGHW